MDINKLKEYIEELHNIMYPLLVCDEQKKFYKCCPHYNSMEVSSCSLCITEYQRRKYKELIDFINEESQEDKN